MEETLVRSPGMSIFLPAYESRVSHHVQPDGGEHGRAVLQSLTVAAVEQHSDTQHAARARSRPSHGEHPRPCSFIGSRWAELKRAKASDDNERLRKAVGGKEAEIVCLPDKLVSVTPFRRHRVG